MPSRQLPRLLQQPTRFPHRDKGTNTAPLGQESTRLMLTGVVVDVTNGPIAIGVTDEGVIDTTGVNATEVVVVADETMTEIGETGDLVMVTAMKGEGMIGIGTAVETTMVDVEVLGRPWRPV